MTYQTPLTKSARRKWIFSLPEPDRSREQETSKANLERIRQWKERAQ